MALKNIKMDLALGCKQIEKKQSTNKGMYHSTRMKKQSRG
jgi:hypothetical protein